MTEDSTNAILSIDNYYKGLGGRAVQITKVINNNIVSAYDDSRQELVIMGRGIGFQKKPGDLIDQAIIEKRFRLESAMQLNQLADLMSDLPSEYLSLVSEIMQKVTPVLNNKLSNSLYITLTDHIHFAVKRAREGVVLQNPLRWDIQQIYPNEYFAALIAVQMTEEMMKVSLEDDEAASIAMHFVNAELNTEMSKAVKITDLIQKMIEILRDFYGNRLDETSAQFERLIVHIRQFAQRVVADDMNVENKDELYGPLSERYRECSACAERIRAYVEKTYDTSVSEEEMTYLIVHLRCISG